MDGAARKRRKEARLRGPIPAPDRLPEAEDDVVQVAESSAESSEGIVPKDLWEEIAALARGEIPERGVGSVRGPATRDPSSTRDPSPIRDPGATRDPSSEMEGWTPPRQDVPSARVPGTERGERVPPSTGRSERLDAPTLSRPRPADLQGGYSHPDQAATHTEHAQVASPDRQLSAERPHEYVLHPPESSSEPRKQPRRAEKPRSLLAGVRRGAKRSLRDAIVLTEVLNPPVVLRDSDRQPPGLG